MCRLYRTDIGCVRAAIQVVDASIPLRLCLLYCVAFHRVLYLCFIRLFLRNAAEARKKAPLMIIITTLIQTIIATIKPVNLNSRLQIRKPELARPPLIRSENLKQLLRRPGRYRLRRSLFYAFGKGHQAIPSQRLGTNFSPPGFRRRLMLGRVLLTSET